MKKICVLILLLLILSLFATACNGKGALPQAAYIPTETPTAQPETEASLLSDTPPIPIPPPPELLPVPPTEPTAAPPTIPQNAISSTLTLLVNGNFSTLESKNINGANYFKLTDLQTAFADILCEDTFMQSLCAAGEGGVPISQFFYHGEVYTNLRQFADVLGFRVAWVPTRDTIIIDAANTLAPYPVFTAEPLPEHIIAQITGSSFHPEAPFGYDHLSYITITHVDFEGENRLGHMIVAASIAQEVLDIFREIYDAGFPIARMRLIDYYGAQDYYSMADNNSVGFNFRTIAGTDRISRHGWGMAIDINPVQNPYLRGDTLWPAAGAAYLDRNDVRPGMIVPGCAVYRAFTSRGWTWGGHWQNPIDYHHFERR